MKRSLNTFFVSSHSLESPKGHDSFQEFGMSAEREYTSQLPLIDRLLER